MSAITRHRITSIEDFLAWEARQETKYEFDGFEPVAMVGGTENHARVQRNLAVALTVRLRGSPCEFFGSDLKLVTATRVRYPDGQVVCGKAHGEGTFTTTPVILFEVTSPCSGALDNGLKVREYCGIASVLHYVNLEPVRIAVTVHERVGDRWLSYPLLDGGVLVLPEIGLEIPLAEFYDGVDVTAAI